MTKLFISYSRANQTDALAIQAWLEQNGWRDEVFIDIDPEHGIGGGVAWREALRQAASRCEAVLLLLSSNWLASKACWSEFQLAERYGKPCIPIRINETVDISDLPSDITNNYQVIDRSTATDLEFETRLKRALDLAGAGPENFPLPPNRRPYPGLQPLREDDAALLFGRDAEVLAALDMVRETRASARKRLVVLLGASGAGKSSLLRAGLWPRLRRDDRHFLALPVVRPANAALSGPEGLWRALEQAAADPLRKANLPAGVSFTRAAIRARLDEDPAAFAEILKTLATATAQALGDPDAPPPTLVLSVDQGEELFNTDGREEADVLLRLIGGLWSADLASLALVSMRSDVYPQLQTDARVDQQELRLFNLSPMPRESLSRVIEGPAERVGLAIEPALSQALLRDAQGADALPLLAFTLERLYLERLQDAELNLADYERLGGVAGAIAAAAERAQSEAIAAGVPREALNGLLRRVFLPHLARVNDAGAFARRVAERAEIDPTAAPLIDILVAQRLLLSDQRDGRQVIEIAHEAILREWPLLAGWLDAERSFLEWREQIERTQAAHAGGHGDLLSGRALLLAQGFLETNAEAIAPEARAFIEQSAAAAAARAAAEQAADEARRRAELDAAEAREKAALAAAEGERRLTEAAQAQTRRLRLAAGATAVVALVAIGLGYVAYLNSRAAEDAATAASQSARQAQTARLASEQQRLGALTTRLHRDGENEKALALAWLGLSTLAEETAISAFPELSRAVYTRPASLLRGFDGPVFSLFDAASDLALTVDSSGRAELWRTSAGDTVARVGGVFVDASSYPLGRFQQPANTLFAIAHFHGDPRRVSILARNGDIVTVDPGAPADRTRRRTAIFGGAAPSLDRVISSVGAPIALSLAEPPQFWDLRTGEATSVAAETEGMRGLFAVSRSGRWALAGLREDPDAPTAIGAWNIESGALMRRFATEATENELEFLTSAQLGADEDFLAIATREDRRSAEGRSVISGRAYFYDFETGEALGRRWLDLSSRLFAPIDGGLLAVVDGAVTMLTEAGAVARRYDFIAYEDGGLFEPNVDASVLATLDGARTSEIWDLASDARIRETENAVLAVSEGGEHLLTQDSLGGIQLRSAETGAVAATLGALGERDWLLAFQSSLARFVGDTPVFEVTARDAFHQIWRLETGSLFDSTFSAPAKRVFFAGQGASLVSVSAAGAVRAADPGAWAEREHAALQTQILTAALDAEARRLVAGGWDGTIRVLDLTARDAPPRVIAAHALGVASLALEPRGDRAISGGHDGGAAIWSLGDGARLATLARHDATVSAVAFSPDGAQALTASFDGAAALWRAETGAQEQTLAGHAGPIYAARYSPDGARVATASDDHTAKIWDARSGALLRTLDGHADAVRDLAWSAEGDALLTVSDDATGVLWDPASGALIHRLSGHRGPARLARIAPDGRRLATGATDGALRLWDAETGALLLETEEHTAPLEDIVFHPGGRLAATASADGSFRLWRIYADSLRERIDAVGDHVGATKPLSAADCRQFGVDGLAGAEIVCQAAATVAD